MTFRVADLDLAAPRADGRRQWSYRTDDTLAEVTAPGYFDHADAPAWGHLDRVAVQAADGRTGVVIGAEEPRPTPGVGPATVAEPATPEPAPAPPPPPAPDPLLAVRLAGMPT